MLPSIKYSTLVTPGAEDLVHHMLIYLCPMESDGVDTHGVNGECETKGTAIFDETEKCRGGVLIAAWAIGGEVWSVITGQSGVSGAVGSILNGF